MSPEDFKRLTQVRLFAGLSSRELESIAARATVRNLRGNTVFMERGDSSASLYLLLSGRVRVYVRDDRGQEQELVRYGRGGAGAAAGHRTHSIH